MKDKRSAQPDRLVAWLGRRSGREITLIWIAWAALLAYGLANILLLGPLTDLRREMVRVKASRVSLQSLEQLLEHRGEIMTKAQGLLDDYRRSRGVEPSALLLQRLDRARAGQVTLRSVYPLGSGPEGQVTRFRTTLAGAPGNLGQLLFALGEGAPPIVVSELALSAERGAQEFLLATATLEVQDHSLPDDWVRLLEGSQGGSPGSQPTAPPVQRQPGVGRGATASAYPYQALERSGVFASLTPQPGDAPLSSAAPTIQTLLQDLSLLGIIWNKRVAIIREKDTGQTYYRKVGEFLGELEVISIARSAVTLRYHDEEGRLE